MELSAMMLGAYFCHGPLAEAMEWDPNLVLVSLIMLGFVGWFTHVYLFYERRYKQN
ncbi:MAG: hypothetical protein HRT44_12540 [Bdellovibrionales bacterium]|nr:hypothetical protein [Bdellovibrionales bacterium]NQZ20066.1 hypothetical protein [Bdellovibrionales bacterium]